MYKSAVISACGSYRYELHRIWEINKPIVMFIMLNPSKADANNDDPTIRRCIDFAMRWGYGGIMVGNLFAYRATKPEELLSCIDPEGYDNSWHLVHMADKCKKIVCAWGNAPIIKKLRANLKQLNNDRLFCIKLSENGTPIHPLYLPKGLKPIPFNRLFGFKKANPTTAKYLRNRKYRLHNKLKEFAKVDSKKKQVCVSYVSIGLFEKIPSMAKFVSILEELKTVYGYNIQYDAFIKS